MFERIIIDYPGFGYSDWPDPKQFAYAFDHYQEITALVVQDAGFKTRWRTTRAWGRTGKRVGHFGPIAANKTALRVTTPICGRMSSRS
jgi:hypothetical protein